MSQNPFSHPLFGSSLYNLIRLAWSNGGVSLNQSPRYLAALASAVARLPFSLIEQLVSSIKLTGLEIPPPIFIIGHWRSGTTHLCNILAQSPDFGFVSPVASGIPHDLLIIGKIFRPWLEKAIPPDRLIDRVPVHIDSPQEDEFGLANMVGTSFLHGLYFPKQLSENFQMGMFTERYTKNELIRWQRSLEVYLKKVYLDQGRRRLIIKNPGHTTKIPTLRKLFPGAQFIHIYRNPFDLYPSMKNYFHKLLPVLSLQNYDSVDIESLIIDTYPKVMERVIKDLSQVPLDHRLEIRYEHLEQDPIKQLDRVYHQLELPGFQTARPLFEDYLSGISGYQKNRYQYEASERARVKTRWKKFIDHYGY